MRDWIRDEMVMTLVDIGWVFGVSIIIYWFVRRLALRFGVYDLPGELKIHSKPIPYLGGIGAALSILIVFLVRPDFPKDYLFLALFPLLIGLWDDICSIKPLTRFILESIFVILLIALGYTLNGRHGVWEIVLTYLFFMGSVNSVNWMDGMDGLLTGVSIIVGLGFFILAKSIGHPWMPQFITMFIAILTPFLFFNFHPAKMFLGDAGSYLIGFTFFFVSVELLKFNFSWKLFFTILSILGVFIVDSTIAVIRRLRNGRHPFYGDRSHVYDQIYKRTGKYLLTVFLMYFIAVLAVILGISIYKLQTGFFLILWLFAVVIIYSLLFKLKFASVTIEQTSGEH